MIRLGCALTALAALAGCASIEPGVVAGAGRLEAAQTPGAASAVYVPGETYLLIPIAQPFPGLLEFCAPPAGDPPALDGFKVGVTAQWCPGQTATFSFVPSGLRAKDYAGGSSTIGDGAPIPAIRLEARDVAPYKYYLFRFPPGRLFAARSSHFARGRKTYLSEGQVFGFVLQPGKINYFGHFLKSPVAPTAFNLEAAERVLREVGGDAAAAALAPGDRFSLEAACAPNFLIGPECAYSNFKMLGRDL